MFVQNLLRILLILIVTCAYLSDGDKFPEVSFDFIIGTL